MSEVQRSGEGPVPPQARKLYEQEYRHAADLFERALKEHGKSDNAYQKEEFKEVMGKAMVVLNETAREMKRKELLKQNQKIEEDFSIYQKSPSPSTRKKLEQDLKRAKEA